MIDRIRKNIGTVAAAFSFFILCIVTFGDLGEIMTEAYWASVRANMASIGTMTVTLTMIQVAIKQGLSEQALQKGLGWIDKDNLGTDKRCDATIKFEEHRAAIRRCAHRQQYISYFLDEYNDRDTAARKRDFLANNNFKTYEELIARKRRFVIWRYRRIRTNVTAKSLRWATTTIKYDRHGRIVNLAEHRSKRAFFGAIYSLFIMLGTVMLTRGLFLESNDIPLYQKFIKLAGHILVITLASVFPIIKEYEKGKFGVPNELDAVNEIWSEFEQWKIPENIKKEVPYLERAENGKSSETNVRAEHQNEQSTENISSNN